MLGEQHSPSASRSQKRGAAMLWMHSLTAMHMQMFAGTISLENTF